MLTRSVLSGSLAVIAMLAGCSSEGSETRSAAASHTPRSTVTATVTKSPTAVPRPVKSTCESPQEASINLLAKRWELVVASRGASDHGESVDDFAEGSEELYSDFEDARCEGTAAMEAAALLNYKTAVLAAHVRAGHVDDSRYSSLAHAGNKLIKVMNIEKTSFIPVTCTSVVGESQECDSLGLGL